MEQHISSNRSYFEGGNMYIMKQVNGRLTGLVTFCVETAFYNGLLKEG